MRKEESLVANYLFNAISTVVNFAFPFMMGYFLMKKLMPDGYGVFSYMLSLTAYFIGFFRLWLPLIMLRDLPKHREDKKILSYHFFRVQSIMTVNLAFTILAYLVFYFAGGDNFVRNKSIYLIFILYIALSVFDFEWFFWAVRRYKIVTVASVIQKAILLAAIVLWVNNPEDLHFYTWIFMLSHVVKFGIYLIYARQLLDYREFSLKGLLTYYRGIGKKAALMYFSLLAETLYISIATLMVGWFLDNAQVAYYTLILSVISVVKQVMTIVMPIMLSYHSEKLEQHKQQPNPVEHGSNPKSNVTMRVTFSIMNMLAIPALVGGVLLSRDLLGIFLTGEEILSHRVDLALSILLVMPVISSYTTFISSQVILPLGMDRFYSLSAFSAAAFNIVANLFMIPWLGLMGAAITSVLTELLILTLCLVFHKKLFLDFIRIKYSWKYILGALTAGMVLYHIRRGMHTDILSIPQILICIVIYGVVYGLCLLLLRDYTVMRIKELVLSKLSVFRQKSQMERL